MGTERRRLVVETKVDSVGDRPQLDDMSWNKDHVVLLALGTSAFDRSQADLDNDADAGFVCFADCLTSATPVRKTSETGRRAWSAVTPEIWSDVLEAGQASEDRTMTLYLERMTLETELHRRAQSAASAGVPIDLEGLDLEMLWADGDVDARPRKLLASAWAADVRKFVWAASPGLNLEARGDGHVTRLGVYPPGWTGQPQGDIFLQVDVGVTGGDQPARASAWVKASGLARTNAAVSAALAKPGSELYASVRSRAGKTVALAAAPPLDARPESAARWILAVVADLGRTRESGERTG